MTTRQYKIFFISIFFLLPELMLGQILHNYELELKKYLDPHIDTLSTREVGFFMIRNTSDLTPEYSIRLVKVSNHYKLEARILDRNLSRAISCYDNAVLKGNKENVLSVGTFTYIIPITDSLKSRIVNIFNKVIICNKDSYRSLETSDADGNTIVMFYDGPICQYRVSENGTFSSNVIRYPWTSSDIWEQVRRTNLRIIEDLRNNSFDESEYNIYK
jgi:hypothetical protein